MTMSGWLRLPRAVRITRPWCATRYRYFPSRFLSTSSTVEHVRVPCASSGDITVSLHNVSKHDTTTPLVVIIPPFSQNGPDPDTSLPSCFQDHPVAVINYRWQVHQGDERPDPPLYWPTPLHDVNFGYAWVMDNLGSGTDLSKAPRPAYIYGSYLGASIAAGLALTESHVPALFRPMTIRGLIAHNGIYNWTMFLPDHPIHKLRAKSAPRRKKRGILLDQLPVIEENPIPFEEEGIFTELKSHTPALFSEPSNLFDPFASACLFFHSANLHVPDDFTTPLSTASSLSAQFTAAVDNLANTNPSRTPNTDTTTTPQEKEPEPEESADELLAKAATLAKQLKPPRKAYLVFPPRGSTLRIPRALFLHDRPHDYSSSSSSSSSRRRTSSSTRRLTSTNNFTLQASELRGLMMRSLDMHELKPRAPAPWEWEVESEDSSSLLLLEGGGGGGGGEASQDERDYLRYKELERRVQSFEVEPPDLEAEGAGHGLGLDAKAEEVVGEWLRERIDEDFGEEKEEEEGF